MEYEGFVPFGPYRLRVRVVGDLSTGPVPLLCLHGGPGGSLQSLAPLEALSARRPVVLFDQLDCGDSDGPGDPDLWTVENFVAQVDAVREGLGLERVHLLGQSWGGMLAQEYALTGPAGLVSLVLSSTLSSTAEWNAEMDRLRTELPEGVDEVLRAHEAAGTTDSAEYDAAVQVFMRRHVHRQEPAPNGRGPARKNRVQYLTMWGPSEFHPTGTLRDWSVRERLGGIRVPTLVAVGQHDHATPRIARTIHEGVAGSELVLFERSGHRISADEPERYLRVVGGFLDRVERAVLAQA